ncbi:hypothetical protein P170DRAFT_425610 [Aspergillus steynii IBT 23096]|uniref:Uncharacterized protein n=1 Tax=Aspergillus steynii IBT 23096 TaxID=1392250 RepID=A0A2I2GER3_9EURO|nr:uncharacterized protein P170DRAFT_425610 [Aspergillus steynii IBT 23096]PLB51378.1 hypothetical protein P170DRAFT_425610 [Aspergillus steynii IBT 23096]
MRAAYFLSTLLAATALASAVPQGPAENAELVPIDDPSDLDKRGPIAPTPDEDDEESFDLEDEEDEVTISHLEERGIFDSGGRVCKKKGQKTCYHVKSNGRCKNLVSSNGKPFISGSADGGCICTVYSQKGCPWIKGKRKSYDERGANFGFNAKSMDCSVKV